MLTGCELKIAVCDDQERDREQITRMTKEVMHKAQISHSVSTYESGKALLEAIQKGARFQILLLDVMMDDMNGMELAAELRKQENKAFIIFISSNREMAMYGYEVSAVRYLSKPLQEEKLSEALMYCARRWQEKTEILLPTDQGQCRISVADIQFVEAFDRGTRFFLGGDALECRLKFGDAEAMLPKSSFLQCHRAFLVNLTWVKSIRNYEFVLKSGGVVPIGKNRYSEIYKKFLNYIAD